jgi:hypothetical protein
VHPFLPDHLTNVNANIADIAVAGIYTAVSGTVGAEAASVDALGGGSVGHEIDRDALARQAAVPACSLALALLEEFMRDETCVATKLLKVAPGSAVSGLLLPQLLTALRTRYPSGAIIAWSVLAECATLRAAVRHESLDLHVAALCAQPLLSVIIGALIYDPSEEERRLLCAASAAALSLPLDAGAAVVHDARELRELCDELIVPALRARARSARFAPGSDLSHFGALADRISRGQFQDPRSLCAAAWSAGVFRVDSTPSLRRMGIGYLQSALRAGPGLDDSVALAAVTCLAEAVDPQDEGLSAFLVGTSRVVAAAVRRIITQGGQGAAEAAAAADVAAEAAAAEFRGQLAALPARLSLAEVRVLLLSLYSSCK